MAVKRAIVFMVWGDKYVSHVADCVRESQLPDVPVYLLTDAESDTSCLQSHVQVIRCDIRYAGKLAKLELMRNLPQDLEIVLFLDVDTRVLGDISIGFEKAQRYGIAMAPAPHYSLEHFRDFGQVMDREGVPRQGQLLYNSGVLFFDAQSETIREVFRLACEIAERDETTPWGDQTYITLAMEILDVNPYTLSPSFNHRGFGEMVSGSVRIWHSYNPVPTDAGDLEYGYLHRHENGAFVRALKVPK